MQKDLKYLNSLKRYIQIITGVFIISLLLGVIVSMQNPDISLKFLTTLKESFGWIINLSPLERMFAIFINNAQTSLFALVLGVLFGIVPLLVVAMNGLIVGMASEIFAGQKGIPFLLAAILPHGIIELPLILISAAIGLRLGHVMYLYIKGERTNLKQEFRDGVLFYFTRIAPLLLVAAMIESFVTPIIASQFLKI
jgi:stage II sporulation protein M